MTDIEGLELTLRQVPGVVAVGVRRTGDALGLEVLSTDPDNRDIISRAVERAANRHADLSIELHVDVFPTAPRQLRIERDLAGMEGVRSAVVQRGPRGEVRAIRLWVTALEAAARVSDALAAATGEPFPTDRLLVGWTRRGSERSGSPP